MALADIIRRIEEDADTEVEAIMAQAQAEAERMLADARREASALAEGILEDGQLRAERERETTLANARLAARDRTLGARHELVSRVLRKVEEALETLDADAYADLIAVGLAQAARGGEKVLVAAADAKRLSGKLEPAVRSALAHAGRDISLVHGGETTEIPGGALLCGPRMTVEVSHRSLVSGSRDELVGRVSAELFGKEDGQ